MIFSICFIVYPTYLILTLSRPIQSLKPYKKRQLEVWRLECELGVVSDADCPVDGGWGPWGHWSPCHGSCDDIGHRRRTRECNNPSASEDGLPCVGPDKSIELCFLTNCTVQDYRKLIEGDIERTVAFHELETVPALLERCLLIECQFEALEISLSNDNTWQLNPETIWNSLQCVKHNMGCPVIGEWGDWGAWSACGARCGRGLRWRLRRCDTPPPSNANLVCTGTPLQAEECEGNQCAVDVRDVERDATGIWSSWRQWSPCSERCGPGVRRRRRTCREMVLTRAVGIWGTHCAGQHDQFEVCENQYCILDGGWSGWSAWGPCSRSCGAGRKSRMRSCTRPIPAGSGRVCVGDKTEVGSCNLKPCEVYSHVVAFFNGDSSLQYDFKEKRSALFHFYVRFLPLSPHGTLVRRGTDLNNPQVRLSLQKWHICLDATGTSRSCPLPRICSPSFIEAVWHTVLITITSETATMRIDDALVPIKGTFPCDPELADDNMHILIGEKLHGEIQEIILNFIQLNMVVERDRISRSRFFPSSVSNIAYDKTNAEEAYVVIENDQYLRLPCFSEKDEWKLEFTVKSKQEAGTILFLLDDARDSWLHVGLQNNRLKIKLAHGELRSESISSTEFTIGEWLDVSLAKKFETNTIEATINAGERLHVVLEGDSMRERRASHQSRSIGQNTAYFSPLISNVVKEQVGHKPVALSLCNDEFFVGGVPIDIKSRMTKEEIPFFSGIVASISINSILQDLYGVAVERYKDNKLQVSARTASVSGSYHETTWGRSNGLNLTCLHARSIHSPHMAMWLFLDTAITGVLKSKTIRTVDDGRILRLVASADNNLRGFYTCRAHTNKRTRNIVTYGVLGKETYNLAGPDTITGLAVFTTLTLVICTLTWLFIEGINDLRNGYGFFRDAHLSPEEEAEAVCNYIDQNMHLIGSKSAAKIAKARARRKGRQLASQTSFVAQEPAGLMLIKACQQSEASASEPTELPALPEVNSSKIDASHDVYRCEPSYISSPRHGSNITSPRTKLTSSSSFEPTSPRLLCSRLLMAKRIHSSRESLIFRRNRRNYYFESPRKNRSTLLTIKSSRCINISPAQKILKRFQQLKGDDI